MGIAVLSTPRTVYNTQSKNIESLTKCVDFAKLRFFFEVLNFLLGLKEAQKIFLVFLTFVSQTMNPSVFSRRILIENVPDSYSG